MDDHSSLRFEALLQEHTGIIRKVAAMYCRHETDRADLMQEIMVQLWRAWPKYDSTRSFSTWMYRVALNVAISQVRNQYRQQRYFVPLEEKHESVATVATNETEQQLAMIYKIVENMDAFNKALFMLYMDERSHREIADVLGITVTNVGTKIGRLKEQIRNELSASK